MNKFFAPQVKNISLSKTDALRIAQIHSEALRGDFLPSLGINFLKAFYQGVLSIKGIYAFGVEENNQLVGFVIGTEDSKAFFKQALSTNFLQLFFWISLQVIKNPFLIKNILETFLYPGKEVGSPAELVVIAIDSKWRGRGLGKILIKQLENAFKITKVQQYKLTVHEDKEAVKFYEHLGFTRLEKFSLYGKIWYIYEKHL